MFKIDEFEIPIKPVNLWSTLKLFGTQLCILFVQVGFNAGDGLRFTTLPGSQTDAVRRLASTSNVASPGKWVYRVDAEDIISGGR